MDPSPSTARLLQFPTYDDYQGARVFPLVEKSSWLGCGFGILALLKDWADTGGGDPWGPVAACHVLVMAFAALAAWTAGRPWRPRTRLVGVLAAGALSQILMLVPALYFVPEHSNVAALLSFFFLSFLFLAPLVSPGWLAGFFGFVVIQVGLLVHGALALGVPGLAPEAPGDILGFLVPSLAFIALLVIWTRRQALETYRLARSDAVHLTLDALSQVLNRPTWLTRAEDRWRRGREAGQASAVIMADIDHFKQVNDSLGHDAGDQVIRAVAQVLLDQTRDADLVGRLGGEEFAVFLPGADGAAALEAAERIRAGVEALAPFGARKVTISLGVFEDRSEAGEFGVLVKEADRRLYAAKAAGRNRAVATV